MKRSKKYVEASSKVENKKYTKDEAIKLVKELATAKLRSLINN